MIWALLEITLPLCLTFLLGLTAGWLLWRWRRRFVSQEDWNKQNQTADQTADTEEMESLRAQCKKALSEREELVSKVASMEDTIEQRQAELSKAESDHKQQTEELNSAKAKLAEQTDGINANTLDQTLELQQLSNTNKELQQKLQQSATLEADRDRAMAQIKKLEEQLLNGQSAFENKPQETAPEVAAELANAKAKAEQLARTNSELQQQLKQAENTGSERDSAIDRVKQLEAKLAQNNQSDNELQESRRKLAELQQQLQQANNAASELNQAKGSIATLRTQLADAKHQLSQRPVNSQPAFGQQPGNESSEQDKRKLQELEAENAKLRQAQGQASDSNQQLQSARTQVTNLTAQLNQEKARSAELKSNLENRPSVQQATPVTSISVGQIKKLNNEIAEKENRIEQLEKKLKNKTSNKTRNKANNKTSNKSGNKTGNKSGKRKQKLAWQKGTTKLGTPGCDHKDDLTEINGIGPAIQKVLNRLGIKSFEQLAEFKAAEIKLVDEALVDFSGRIKRDEWVPQAKVIMRNGHQPPGKSKASPVKKSPKPKKPQKPKKAQKPKKTQKKVWQKGKTRFGTPGSLHRDDLKVINGIGPVIEKSLNWYGIKSWEQLATLKVKEVKTIDEALDFPGRIDREQWVKQAKELVKLYPDRTTRPTRRTFLNQAAAR